MGMRQRNWYPLGGKQMQHLKDVVDFGLLGYVHLKYQHTDNHFVHNHKFILDNADVIASSHAHLKSEKTTSSVRRAGSGNKEVPVWYILSLFFPLVLRFSFFSVLLPFRLFLICPFPVPDSLPRSSKGVWGALWDPPAGPGRVRPTNGFWCTLSWKSCSLWYRYCVSFLIIMHALESVSVLEHTNGVSRIRSGGLALSWARKCGYCIPSHTIPLPVLFVCSISAVVRRWRWQEVI